LNKIIFIAAVLAMTTVLVAGLTVLPNSVQEAQANPCANQVEVNSGGAASTLTTVDERECTIIGNDIDFEEAD
jgi:hypothetical protein